MTELRLSGSEQMLSTNLQPGEIVMRSEVVEIRDSKDILHDCPKCNKKALAQVEPGVFECIWCGFRRDVTQQGGFWSALLALGGAGLLLILL